MWYVSLASSMCEIVPLMKQLIDRPVPIRFSRTGFPPFFPFLHAVPDQELSPRESAGPVPVAAI